MSDKVLGWHWLHNNGCLRYAPYSKVEVGQTLTAKGPLKLCENGMHASRRALDALQYAPGPIICRVELSGELLEGIDILCARRRKVLAMSDATRVLHEFACWCVEQALLRERELGREPDRRSWDAIEVKRKWMNGEATDEELEMARIAAYDAERETSYAARAVARFAALAAALAAARAAAWVAARDTVWNAVWAAAGAAALTATCAAARTAQNAKLEEMLNDLLKGGETEGRRLMPLLPDPCR